MSLARTPLPSIRAKLYTLVLACAVPVLIGYVALVRDAGLRERVHTASDARTVAEVLAAAVDRDIESGETAGQVLAGVPVMARGDFAEIHAVVRRMLRPEFIAQAFVLSLPDGTPLLDTRHDYGVKLPPADNADDIRQVALTGKTVASGFYRQGAGGQFALLVDVPVWLDGKVRFVLSVHLRPRRLADLLDNQHLPARWIAEIYDRRLAMVSRSVAPADYLGTPMIPALARAAVHAGAGTVDLREVPGESGAAAFARTSEHGWIVAIRYPHEATGDLLGHSMPWTLAAIGGLLSVSLLLAWALGGAIARAVQNLAGPAEQLGRGEPLVLPPPAIREVDALARALRQVDAELQAHRHGLEALVLARTQELASSKAQLENVYASIPVGLCFMDTEMRIVMVNDYLATRNGRPSRDHAGLSMPELLGPIGSEIERHYRHVIETGRPLTDVEATCSAPAMPGDVRHWMSSYYPVVGPNRRLVGVSAVVLDITERKLQQQRERDHQELFRALFEASGDAHVLLAYGAGYVSANQAAATLFGFSDPAGLLGESPASLSPLLQEDGSPSGEAALGHMRRTLEHGRDAFQWLHRRVDGTEFHADVLVTRVDIGGVGMMQATIRDISARVAADARLRATRIELEAALHEARTAGSAKGEFLANMSHELRTPMNAIVGLARLLEESQLGQRERGYVARMRTAAHSLLGMFGNLLDFSRIDAGQLTLERIPFCIDDVLASIAVLHGPGAWGKGIELVFAVDPALPALLQGDPVRLEQVLLNLIGNAVKFTSQGEIVLSITLLDCDDDMAHIAFEVRDTGIGIAPEIQAGIFEVFSQADNSTVRKYGGAGLGLSISRRLVGLAGGALSVESMPGAGAAFRFALEMPVLAGRSSVAGTALRVLVADDNASARAALVAAGTAMGWQVVDVAGGVAAVDAARAARYDIAFIDSAMPDLDGLHVVDALLHGPHSDSEGPAPRLCLLAPDPDTERFVELAATLGIGAVLGKPFTGTTLRCAVTRLLGSAAAGVPIASAAPAGRTPLAGALHGMRVLLVEDNPINQEVASFILVHAGATLDIAVNGRAALSILHDDAGYDVVLMDLQMPVMNGFEATAAIRAVGMALPIVAMTANALAEDRQRSLDAGMQAHLDKPIDVDALVATLRRVTHWPSGVSDPALHTALGAAPCQLQHLPGIDLKATLPRFAGRFERFAELFVRFADGQVQTLADLRAQLDAGERGTAGQLAHRLRGVAANLGATAAADAAHALEQALRADDDGTVRLRLADLARALDGVTATARALGVSRAKADADGEGDGDGAPPLADDGAALHAPLARLLDLLQNNNMKAIGAADDLRPLLAAHVGPGASGALFDAIATLRFDDAVQLAQALITKEGTP